MPDILTILEDVVATEFGRWCFLGQCEAEHLLLITVESQATGGERLARAWRTMQQRTIGIAENC